MRQEFQPGKLHNRDNELKMMVNIKNNGVGHKHHMIISMLFLTSDKGHMCYMSIKETYFYLIFC